MQPPPQNLHLMLTRCPYCKTLFHLRFQRWVSHCVFLLKASPLAFCSDFLMQPSWTQMYFEMRELLTSHGWVEQWFGFTTRGWMGVVTALFPTAWHHHFFCSCLFDMFLLQPSFKGTQGIPPPSPRPLNTFSKPEGFLICSAKFFQRLQSHNSGSCQAEELTSAVLYCLGNNSFVWENVPLLYLWSHTEGVYETCNDLSVSTLCYVAFHMHLTSRASSQPLALL